MIGKWSEAFRKGFDIIIDDGSHEPSHQIFTFKELNSFLNVHGTYVIEDVREPELVANAVGGKILKFNKCSDDCLVIIQK